MYLLPVYTFPVKVFLPLQFRTVCVPCNLEISRSLQTARGPFQWGVLWRDNFKGNRENCHDFVVFYCARNWEGNFGSRESSSSQQPFIPCELTCYCFPQLQARKRIITIVKKTEVIFL